MRIKSVLAATILIFSLGSAFADPVGHYRVTGTDPGGGSSYKGDVIVAKTGDTYSVTWNIGGTKYVGTGIGDDNFLAVSYRSGNDTGLALFGKSGDGYAGVWTYAGGKKTGTEKWDGE
jgi:hypothetical protein